MLVGGTRGGLRSGWFNTQRFAFKFKQLEHLQWFLCWNWYLDHKIVLLKHWHPLFDANREHVYMVPLWLSILRFSMQYWSEDHFTNIGNILGSFLEAVFSFKETKLKKVARNIISINIREGIPEDMMLTWGQYQIKQILDYENVPFQCKSCHTYGNPAIDY